MNMLNQTKLPDKVVEKLDSKLPLLVAVLPAGSHLWGCARRGSDVDLVVVFEYPAFMYKGLCQLKTAKTMRLGRYDVVAYEFKYFCQQVLRNNLNFMLAALAEPLHVPRRCRERWREVRAVTKLALSARRLGLQVLGLAHNQLKDARSGRLSRDAVMKKALLVLRYLSFGFVLVRTRRVSFDFDDNVRVALSPNDWQLVKGALWGEVVEPKELLGMVERYALQLKKELVRVPVRSVPRTLEARLNRALCETA